MDQLVGIGSPSHNEYQSLADHLAQLPKTYAGSEACPAVSANNYSLVTVTFTHNMPNTDYAVSAILSRGSSTGAYRKGMEIVPFAKAANGFKLMVFSTEAIDVDLFTIEWTATSYNK